MNTEKKPEEEKEIKEDQRQEAEVLKKQLEEAKKSAEERLNQLKYLHADFDNYRKQFEKEKCQIIKLANENLIRELIAVLDDFDASINSRGAGKDKEGLMLIEKKFFKILEKHGLKRIESLGKKFNPHLHEVLCKECSDRGEDEILEEIQKGYTLDSKVIRASKVKVAKNEKSLDKEKEKLNKEEKLENKEK
ncbi:nucleotide exchange factor GrpE [Candidatus Pacearchaeota archaeon RBG_13_36_9]|nr:MAG: nucleotide exchange factor GrpE [Candidatus Pacearchaeota archaeon RBG_13_36_9]